jgi:hypothetical protein
MKMKDCGKFTNYINSKWKGQAESNEIILLSNCFLFKKGNNFKSGQVKKNPNFLIKINRKIITPN